MSLSYPNWWRKNFLLVELFIALLATAGLLLWCVRGSGLQELEKLVHGNRGQIYGTLASICGSLLGFVIATLSVVLGFNTSRRLDVLRKSTYYKQLWSVFTSAIRVLAFTTCAWLLALFVDRDSSPNLFILVLCFGATFLAVLRLGRAVWVLERIVEILTAPGAGLSVESSEPAQADAVSGSGPPSSQAEEIQ